MFIGHSLMKKGKLRKIKKMRTKSKLNSPVMNAEMCLYQSEVNKRTSKSFGRDNKLSLRRLRY